MRPEGHAGATEDLLTAPRRYDPVRWLEYSGVLVVLGILADSEREGVPVTALVASTDLCNETVYSALAVGVDLGLVWVEVVGRGVPLLKRYHLTESGLRLGRIAQQVRDEMSTLPAPPRRKQAHRPAEARMDLMTPPERGMLRD